MNYDSTIESSADPNWASEGGPGPARNLCITRGDGLASADEGRDDVCSERWGLADGARDRTCDGGSVLYGDPDPTNNSHDGACDDNRYSFF